MKLKLWVSLSFVCVWSPRGKICELFGNQDSHCLLTLHKGLRMRMNTDCYHVEPNLNNLNMTWFLSEWCDWLKTCSSCAHNSCKARLSVRECKYISLPTGLYRPPDGVQLCFRCVSVHVCVCVCMNSNVGVYTTGIHQSNLIGQIHVPDVLLMPVIHG